MSTATLTLEPQNVAASALNLKAEFAKAKFSDVRTSMTKGAVHIEMPITRLSEYQFFYDRAHCSWATSTGKVVLELKDFVVEQRAKKNMFRVVCTPPQAAPAVHKKTSRVREIFFQRSLRAIEELQSLDERRLVEAVQEPTDYSVLVSALNTAEALASIRSHDPLAGARLRGFEVKRKMLEAEGGSLSAAQAAKLLKISRQAIDKRRNEGKLLALELGKKGYHYPAWQFGLEELDEILRALQGRDGWEQLGFFLNPSAILGDQTPLEFLQKGRNQVADVVKAAAVYGEQG